MKVFRTLWVKMVLETGSCSVTSVHATGIGEMCRSHAKSRSLFGFHQMTIQKSQEQMDHICTKGTLRRSLLIVRVRRETDVSSDHYLLTTTVKLILKGLSGTTSKPILCYNTNIFKDPGIGSTVEALFATTFLRNQPYFQTPLRNPVLNVT